MRVHAAKKPHTGQFIIYFLQAPMLVPVSFVSVFFRLFFAPLRSPPPPPPTVLANLKLPTAYIGRKVIIMSKLGGGRKFLAHFSVHRAILGHKYHQNHPKQGHMKRINPKFTTKIEFYLCISGPQPRCAHASFK